jgi:hypothetical protein
VQGFATVSLMGMEDTRLFWTDTSLPEQIMRNLKVVFLPEAEFAKFQQFRERNFYPSLVHFYLVKHSVTDFWLTKFAQHLWELRLVDSIWKAKDDKILDGGFSKVGIESTIINCTELRPVILRPGQITDEMIETILSINLERSDSTISNIKSSGLLDAHYSPNAKVVLEGSPKPGDGLIAFAHIPTPVGVIRLASPKNEKEYAQMLYSAFRQADHKGIKVIRVIPPVAQGLGKAIVNRLTKASYKQTS